MTELSREALLAKIKAADDLPREAVTVPEWDVTVWVRSMTGTERDRWEADMLQLGEGRALENIRARLVLLTAVDANGVRLFGDDDAEWLGGKGAAALDRLFAAASKLNRLGKRDLEALAGN